MDSPVLSNNQLELVLSPISPGIFYQTFKICAGVSINYLLIVAGINTQKELMQSPLTHLPFLKS